ncbi:type I DNA specificity S subunit [Acetobacter pasteurianus NBRC 3299]|nr:hypothetical protein BBA71_12675 [Acetobacter pasteurianus]GCD76406.1 type I DNA specificity S subunit [Acetobacter pasteurianus NBRC 3299]
MKNRDMKLSDLIEIKHGFAFKGEFFSDIPTAYVLATPGNFAIGGGFQWGKMKYYNGALPDGYCLSEGDIIVTMTDLSKEADTLGYAASVPASTDILLHNQRIGKIIPKKKEVNIRFIYWLMRSPDYRDEILASYTGSTVKHTSPSRILSFEFTCPSPEDQHRIALILDFLDNKIDLNRRTNETLEAMARALFRDWFVDFGPTRAKMAGEAPYLAPELWELFPDRLDEEGKPEGWINSLVGKQFDVTMGQSPPGDTYNSDGAGIPFYQGKTDFGFIFPQRRMYCTAPTRFANALDSLVSVRAPVGDVNFSEEKCCIGRGLASVRHPQNLPYYTYFTMKFLRDIFSSFENTGTVFGSINKKQFANLPLIESGLEKAFERQVMPTCSKIIANETESRTLAQLRDLLLPKLMSGEISIRDAEKMVEDAA